MNAHLKIGLAWCAACLFALFATAAHANFHLFKIQQIFSNADGTVQFVVLKSFVDGEDRWSGHYIRGIDSDGITARNYTFAIDLPDGGTGGKSVLVATQGFAALGIIAPDFVVPNNFVNTVAGTVDFAGVDSISYGTGQLPTDGTNSLMRDGSKAPNLAQNFAGSTASVTGGAPATPNYQGLWWKTPGGSESGWGINFAHQGDTIFASWFTYDVNGRGWWLVMTAHKTAPNTYSRQALPDARPGVQLVPFDPTSRRRHGVGTGTLTFTDANNGTFAYVVRRHLTDQGHHAPDVRAAVRRARSARCATSRSPPTTRISGGRSRRAPSPAGASISRTRATRSSLTWFTYDLDGTPLWLVVTAPKTNPNVYLRAIFIGLRGRASTRSTAASVVTTKVGTRDVHVRGRQQRDLRLHGPACRDGQRRSRNRKRSRAKSSPRRARPATESGLIALQYGVGGSRPPASMQRVNRCGAPAQASQGSRRRDPSDPARRRGRRRRSRASRAPRACRSRR